MNFNRKNLLALGGAVVLAGAIIVGGIYAPTAWKVFRGMDPPEEQVVIQTPPIDYGNAAETATSLGEESQGVQSTEPAIGDNEMVIKSEEPETSAAAERTETPKGGSEEIKKYKEPDLNGLNLAPSIESYFGQTAFSDAARTLAFGTAWNIHQYVDGYLFGVTAGPQMNEEDIKKYIIFHRTLWDKQMESEANVTQAATFEVYFKNLLNRGADAFDSKDKVRIEQFHQEIHDLDTHLFRDDLSSKVYGATPFSTKRSE